ncbi:G5 domain-containing protein [Bifidobacterium oedipodis]|uniref:Lytic transglycosylase n=1 Tax=Bifidobacterium oedipodis TaxID=2675322 RepID=A0A7Y0EQX9_9BIFI|nr:G5 domain-containing protein [Bifidobacterium sp. DSM 109957]NMM94821.1 lytic transglycosylase [Bifidobacterium sp. DSM 109957]
MTRRWTPQRFAMLRRIRVAACVISLSAAMIGSFAFTARKTVALTVNGETTTVSTYAMTATRLLQEQGIDVKTHDLVETSSGDHLANHAVVTVRSAYQTTITIDGVQVPFWTVATSVDQLLGFFEENETNAASITVDIDNVYNQLTGGLVINANGPVTVIADGKSSVAPNGKLPAASILDSKGITLNKEDRVSVEKDNGTTILRVQRVTHGQETRTVSVPFSTQTIVDSSLAAGQVEIRQQGVNGEKTQTLNVTYVDGVAESETVESETVTTMPVDQIVAVGPSTSGSTGNSGTSGSQSGSASGNGSTAGSSGTTSGNSSTSGNSAGGTTGGSTTSPNASGNTGNSNTGNSGNSNTGNSGNDNTSDNNATDTPSDTPNADTNDTPSDNTGSGDTGGSTGNTTTPSGRLWHPTPAQAQAYAAGAAAQRGWTGNEWDCLLKLWMRESSWLWYAENASSGAYGIPQALPADKMAAFGANYRDDAAVQIDWGLSYIAQRYGSPSEAWRHSEEVGWY